MACFQNHQLEQAMTGGGTQESNLPYGHGDPYNELWKVCMYVLQEQLPFETL